MIVLCWAASPSRTDGQGDAMQCTEVAQTDIGLCLRCWEAIAEPDHEDCACPCHDVIQPGLMPCPECEHSSRYDR